MAKRTAESNGYITLIYDVVWISRWHFYVRFCWFYSWWSFKNRRRAKIKTSCEIKEIFDITQGLIMKGFDKKKEGTLLEIDATIPVKILDMSKRWMAETWPCDVLQIDNWWESSWWWQARCNYHTSWEALPILLFPLLLFSLSSLFLSI